MSPPGPEQPGPPTQLNYAKRPPLAWISRHWKLFVFLAVCIAIGITIYRNRDSLKHRVLWLYWSHRVAVFAIPEPVEIVVRNSSPLAANSDYFSVSRYSYFCPATYRQLIQFDPRLGDPSPVAFIGTLRRPDGIRRLVMVDATVMFADKPLNGVYVRVLPLPGVFDPLPPPPSPWHTAAFGQITPPTLEAAVGVFLTQGDLPRLFGIVRKTGVVDPSDRSHIILQLYEGYRFGLQVNGMLAGSKIGDIDVYLHNDDSMRFVLRRIDGGSEVLGAKAPVMY